MGAARRLAEAGQRVVHRGVDDAALRAARLAAARAVIANGTDDENASLILAARQLGFTGPVFAVVEEPFYRRAHDARRGDRGLHPAPHPGGGTRRPGQHPDQSGVRRGAAARPIPGGRRGADRARQPARAPRTFRCWQSPIK